jgi:hypothetical protein
MGPIEIASLSLQTDVTQKEIQEEEELPEDK